MFLLSRRQRVYVYMYVYTVIIIIIVLCIITILIQHIINQTGMIKEKNVKKIDVRLYIKGDLQRWSTLIPNFCFNNKILRIIFEIFSLFIDHILIFLDLYIIFLSISVYYFIFSMMIQHYYTLLSNDFFLTMLNVLNTNINSSLYSIRRITGLFHLNLDVFIIHIYILG
jgi:hypothetical protein